MAPNFGGYPHRLDLHDRWGLLVDQVRGKYCSEKVQDNCISPRAGILERRSVSRLIRREADSRTTKLFEV